MAITVSDSRTLIDEADSTTGWTGSDGTPTLFTTEPEEKETTGHLGYQVSNEEHYMYHTHGSGINMSSGMLAYVWVLPQGIMDTKANYGYALVLGDGTNINAYQVGGSDAAVFRHDSGSNTQYQCMVIDTGSLPTGEARAGTFASFNSSSVTQFGANFQTLVKSVGGVENCFVDIIRVGNGGLTITGTDSANYWMDDLAVLDAAGTSGQSYGICRKLGEGVYGFQGRISLGSVTTGTDTMSIIDQTFLFEDRGLGTDKYGFTIQGGTGTQTYTFTNANFLVPLGVGAFFTATDTDVENLDVTGCLFSNWDQGFALTTDATNGPNWDWSNNKFVGCSQIDIGKTAFANNIIDSTTDANGGMLISSTTSLSNVSNLSFISDGTGHAIYITATGTYTFDTFTYSGYAATDGSTGNECVYNNSGGAVTLNISGGQTPTIRNGAGASTTVNNNQSLDVTVQDTGTTPIQNAVVAVYDASDDSELANDETDVNGQIPTVSVANGTDLYIRVRKSTSGTRYYPVETVATMDGDLSLTITMTADNIAP